MQAIYQARQFSQSQSNNICSEHQEEELCIAIISIEIFETLGSEDRILTYSLIDQPTRSAGEQPSEGHDGVKRAQTCLKRQITLANLYSCSAVEQHFSSSRHNP